MRPRRAVGRAIAPIAVVLIAVVLTAVVFAATVLPVAAASSARAKGPCALLKRREIAEVFAADTGTRTKRQPGPACVWKVAGGPKVLGGGEVITVLDRGASAVTAFSFADQFDGGAVEAIDDLGREAKYLPTLDAVFVLVDNKTLVSVQGVFPASPTTTTSVGTRAPVSASAHRDQLVALARLAAARV